MLKYTPKVGANGKRSMVRVPQKMLEVRRVVREVVPSGCYVYHRRRLAHCHLSWAWERCRELLSSGTDIWQVNGPFHYYAVGSYGWGLLWRLKIPELCTSGWKGMSQGKKDTEGRGNCRNQGRKMQTSLVFWEPQVSATSLGLNMWCHETLHRTGNGGCLYHVLNIAIYLCFIFISFLL